MKESWYYFPLGIGIAIIANFIWLSIAKTTNDSGEILILGAYWDIMILLTFIVIPFIFFEVNLSKTQYLGLGLIFTGFVVTKL